VKRGNYTHQLGTCSNYILPFRLFLVSPLPLLLSSHYKHRNINKPQPTATSVPALISPVMHTCGRAAVRESEPCGEEEWKRRDRRRRSGRAAGGILAGVGRPGPTRVDKPEAVEVEGEADVPADQVIAQKNMPKGRVRCDDVIRGRLQHVTLCGGREDRCCWRVESAGSPEVSITLFYEQHGETTKRKRGRGCTNSTRVTAFTTGSNRLVEVGSRRLCGL
jgi:hypothetical protein